MANVIVILIVIILLGCSLYKIYTEKKKGRHCMGCPSSGSCTKCNCELEDN